MFECLLFVNVALSEDGRFRRKKKSQMWHLLLWSVISCKPALTHFFVLHTAAPLGTSKALSTLSQKSKFGDSRTFLRQSLLSAAVH